MGILGFVLVVFVAFGLALLFYKSFLKPAEKKDEKEAFVMLNENLNAVTKNMMTQMNELHRQMDLRLRENAETLQNANRHMGDRLDNAAKVVTTVTDRLGKMEEANKRIYEVGKDIASLQEILRSPKLRGNLGEQFLGDLLSNLPKEMYQLQYTFKNGKTVDAIIRFKDSLIPIDSKFPLENFRKFAAAQEEKDKKAARKTFISDVRKRIDEVAEYILPDEKTLEFALLYIPAENVYYEVIIKDEEGFDISAYALKKKVIPVSPNNLFVYLQTVLMGLRGMQIERGAREMQSMLARLKGDFGKFSDDFQVLGSHLNNASNKYTDTEKRLERIGGKLDQMDLLSSEKHDQELLTQ
ncbi:MAG: hypothetical protein UY05_C0020G0005 [Candidatus Peregrinibacteria bacterium GW2011_GWA2_47_7]|nr:MAG: hypothetical protein UY05_C0020G0005 [Candidatus Peregrinibacteria bacterium GW2011_GWA2_47_7]